MTHLHHLAWSPSTVGIDIIRLKDHDDRSTYQNCETTNNATSEPARETVVAMRRFAYQAAQLIGREKGLEALVYDKDHQNDTMHWDRQCV